MNFNGSSCCCLVVTTLIYFSMSISSAEACNEAVCASIVSKCMLTKSCRCELKNCTCCKDCFDCLTYLFSECCSCVGLCPKPIDNHHIDVHSQVGELTEAMPDLFSALTQEIDLQKRWSTLTFPVDIDQSFFQPPKTDSPSTGVYTIENTHIVVDPLKHFVTVNCSVVFHAECMPMHKCKKSCSSMGASHFRWFHDGCCECVGPTCLNYGVNESRCTTCSMEDDQDVADDTKVENKTEKDILPQSQ